MTTKLEIQKLLAEALQKCFAVSKQPDQVHLERPADYSHGDWASNIPMVLAKELKQNPKQIAEKLVAEISADKGALLQSVEVAGPGFINFRVLDSVLVGELEEIARLKEKFGHQQINSGKVILVEHTSPNPNKEFHLGHLKNNVTGLAVSYLLEASGAKIFRDCINNNRGIAIVLSLIHI